MGCIGSGWSGNLPVVVLRMYARRGAEHSARDEERVARVAVSDTKTCGHPQVILSFVEGFDTPEEPYRSIARIYKTS